MVSKADVNDSALMEQTQATESKSKVATVCAIKKEEDGLERVQQVKALTAKPDCMSSIPWTEMVERENLFLQIVF